MAKHIRTCFVALQNVLQDIFQDMDNYLQMYVIKVIFSPLAVFQLCYKNIDQKVFT